MKNFYIVLTFLVYLNISVNAQIKSKSKQIINNKIALANELIWHYNINLIDIDYFQDELLVWFKEPNKELMYIPKFTFSDYRTGINKYTEDKYLNDLIEEINYFNTLCLRLENIQYLNSEDYRKEVYSLIKSINFESINIAAATFEYSRTNIEKYKYEDISEQLEIFKNIVLESKNLILSLRYRNDNQLKYDLKQLDLAIKKYNSDFNIMNLQENSNINIDLTNLKKICQDIYYNAYILIVGSELYLQSSYTEKEYNQFLKTSIENYNDTENKLGSSTAYNKILSKIDSDILLFLEEPRMAFPKFIKDENPLIIEIKKEEISIEETLYTNMIKKVISEKEINVNEKEEIFTTIISIEELMEPEVSMIPLKEPIKEKNDQNIKKTKNNNGVSIKSKISTINSTDRNNETKIEKFDVKNNNSLSGSLQNNLIILLDVSASMKNSGMLDIVKESIMHIMSILREKDKISLIAYSGESKVLISKATKHKKLEVLKILNDLNSSGGSDLYNALIKGYKLAEENYLSKGNNKLIIASDGVFGVSTHILSLVEEKTKQDYSLSVFQYTNSETIHNTKALYNLSKIGNGSFRDINSNNEAISSIMQEIKKEFK